MDEYLHNPLIQLAIIIAALVLILKLVYQVLKTAKVSAFQNRSFFEAFFYLLAKKAYMERDAKRARKQNMFLKSGKIYEEIGEFRKALQVYEEGQEYDVMGVLLEKLNKESEAIEIYKKSGNSDNLVKLLLKRKNVEAAGIVLENNNRFQEAAELYYNYERYEKAAQIYEKKGFYKKAALIYEKGGDIRKAAVNFEKWFVSSFDTMVGFQNSKQLEQELIKAVDLYTQLNEPERAYDLLIKYGKFEKAAEVAIKMNRLSDAAKNFERAQMPIKAAEIYERLDQPKIAWLLRGESAFAKGNTLEAAEWFLKGEDYTRAAELFEWDKKYAKAAYCFFMNQNFLGAADNYLKDGNEEEAAKMFEMGREWKMAANISAKYGKFQKAGELYENALEYFKAGASFIKVDDDRRALANFQLVPVDSPDFNASITHMANIFLKNRKPQLVIEKIEKLLGENPIDKSNIEWFYVLGQAYENAGNFKRAFEIYQLILTENYSFKDVHQKIKDVEGLIQKYKEMELISEDSSERYRIIEKVGEGGMGVVFKAEDTVLKRVVALKILNKTLVADKRNLERFFSEARSTASLTQANIVTVYDVGQIKDDYFISMEFIEGENFMSLIRRKKVFSPSQIIFIAIKLFKALDYSHRKGIIHRDIKPHNIMITKQKEIKIMDFGLAVILGDQKKGESGVITGTPYYMSPEQIQGIPVDHRTDIYSSGTTLFHLTTGHVPFKGENIFYQHLFDPVPPIKKYRSDVPEKLCQIIEKCMEKKREQRFQSAMEVLNEMKDIKI
ncbi:MAG: protein kinase [Acidobacteriota bacterium]|nr:protein kinase [Acidobacteriota bacterium]